MQFMILIKVSESSLIFCVCVRNNGSFGSSIRVLIEIRGHGDRASIPLTFAHLEILAIRILGLKTEN
jgi:hypothetical protein